MGSSQRRIVTNNPMVAAWGGFSEADEYLTGDARAVTVRCRDLVHKGYVLLTHPMAGSLKPGENPFRTIILESTWLESTGLENTGLESAGLGKTAPVDFRSLSLIESALEAFRKFPVRWGDLLPVDKPLEAAFAKIRDDFETVDYSLFLSAVLK